MIIERVVMCKSNILVTAIGSFSADIVIKTLQKKGYRVIGTNIYPKQWIANGDVVNRFYQVPKANEEKQYIDKILEICKLEQVKYIFPLTDAEIDIFNKYRSEFDIQNIILCISSYDTIAICRDKRKTSEILKTEEDVNIIPEYSLENLKKGEVNFPLICKKINGRSSQGLKKIYNVEELTLFLEERDLESYLIQPYIEGDILTVDIVRDRRSGKCVAVPRKELLRTLNGAGTTVKVFTDSKLENLCMGIADKLDVNGCVNFEFIESNSKKYFLECNPRFSGGVKFTCMSGYDCILNHLRCFQGKEIDEKDKIVQQYIARKYEEYITLVDEGDEQENF